ncbi:hypothetical protein F5X99DRAFT_405114 [Biscogniauxia marginata]|nr:hypothetical protein F5X99DRAFT_405114 [Biscogniauxia marginata]
MPSYNFSRASHAKKDSREARYPRTTRLNPAYRPRIEDHLFAKVTDANDYSDEPSGHKYAPIKQKEGSRRNPIVIDEHDDDTAVSQSRAPRRSPSPDHIPSYARGWLNVGKKNSSKEDSENLTGGGSVRTSQGNTPEPSRSMAKQRGTVRGDSEPQSLRKGQAKRPASAEYFDYDPNDRAQVRSMNAMKEFEERIQQRARANRGPSKDTGY